MQLKLFFAPLISFLVMRVVRAEMLEPSPCQSSNSSSSQETLNAVLLRWQNNTDVSYYLQLLPGEHCIRNSSFIRDRANVTIVGNGSVVTCLPGQGLLFYNTTGLRLAGITIDGCGLELDLIRTFVATIKTDLDFFFDLSNVPDQYVAVALGNCEDFEMEDSSIVNTAGLGLLAVNLVGQSSFTNVLFQQNIPNGNFIYRPPMSFSEFEQLGGGAIFSYVDFLNDTEQRASQLSLVNCSFVENSYFGFSSFYHIASRDPVVAAERYIGGGGGLTLLLSQLRYNSSVAISNSRFANNTGFYGGGVYVGYFLGVFGTSVIISNCSFDRNGIEDTSLIAASALYRSLGSALSLFTDLQQEGFELSEINPSPSFVAVTDSVFVGNTAFSGVVSFMSLYKLVIPENDLSMFQFRLKGCVFNNNKAVYGAALNAFEYKGGPEQLGASLILEDIEVSGNELIKLASSVQSNIHTGTINLNLINFTLTGTSNFSQNIGSAIRAKSSYIYIQGDVFLTGNLATYGGGLNLDGSVVSIQPNSTLEFIRNTALTLGGAIYVDFSSLSTPYFYQDCFLYFDNAVLCSLFGEEYCGDITKMGVTIKFEANTALLGGAIFGSTLETCTWAMRFREVYSPGTLFEEMHLFEILFKEGNFSSPFQFDEAPNNERILSTPITHLIATDVEQTETLSVLNLAVAPGIDKELSLRVADAFGHLVPGVVTSRSSTPGVSSTLGSDYVFINYNSSATTTLSVTSGTADLDNAEVTLLSIDTFSSMVVNVSFESCPGGFFFDGESSRCRCLDGLNHSRIGCTPEGGIVVPLNTWVGVHGDTAQVVLCSFDFCSRQVVDINTSPLYERCNADYNRSGPGCGGCVADYSVVFGSSRCLRCSNAFLSLLLLFAFLGVALMAALLFLRINIAGGFLNGVLYFSNIASLYAPLFGLNILVLVSWFSLNFGIETCFFDGMKPIHVAFLNFFFPLYLYLLVFAIVLLARWSNRFSEWLFRFKSSPTKVFATILVMTYSSLLESCIQALSFTTLQTVTVNGTTGENRWRVDPSQRYFHGLHGLVAMISIVLLLFFLIPAPILGMFPAKIFSITILRKYKPVYDAVWAPLKPRYLYWVSLRLLYRIPPLLFINFAPVPLNLFLLTMFLLIGLFVHEAVQPFRGTAQNVLDGILQVLLVIFSNTSLYFTLTLQAQSRADLPSLNERVDEIYDIQGYVLSFLLFLSYLTCFVIFAWDIATAFPELRKACSSAICRKPAPLDASVISAQVELSTASANINSQHPPTNQYDSIKDGAPLPKPTTPIATFSELRESLLEDSQVIER